MMKIKKATAASKAEPKKVPAVPEEAKPLTTAALGTKYDEGRSTPLIRGPQTGDGQMPDLAFIGQYATPEELASFKAAVESRRLREPENFVWLRCSNPACRMVMRLRPDLEGEACAKCNFSRRQDGGHLQKMTDAEVNEHLLDQAQRRKAQAERDFAGGLFKENQRRQAAGLPLYTADEFRRILESEFRELRERGRKLERVAALYRRSPR